MHWRTPSTRPPISSVSDRKDLLETPPAVVAQGHNPLCGDEIQVYLFVEDGVVRDVKVGGQGCSISQSSASMMTQAVKGKPVADAHRVLDAFRRMMGLEVDGEPEDVNLGDLEALQGVVKFPVRIKCATLAWTTLAQAMDEAGA